MQTPLMRTGLPFSYSTRPFPSTHRTRPVRRDDAVLDLVGNAFLDRAPGRGEHACAIVGMDLARVAGKRTVEGARQQPVHAFEVVGPANLLGDEIPVPGAHHGRVERKAQALLAPARLRLRSHPLQRKRHLGGDDAGQLQFVGAEHAGFRVIQHELADHASHADERHERHRRDALGPDHRQIRQQRGIAAHVAHDDRLRIRRVGCPGRVTLDGPAIGIRQTAIRLEAHHAVGVEEEDRSARDIEPLVERVQGGSVDVLDGSRVAHRARQREAHGNLGTRCQHPVLQRIDGLPPATCTGRASRQHPN
jgi:hypothetical protein